MKTLNMIDKRKNIRILYEDEATLISEGRTIDCQSINISNTGMQIVVHVPLTYKDFKSIVFTLPKSEKTVEIPCKLVRTKQSKPGTTDEHVVGIEFEYQAEAQMALIENYIKEMKQNQLAESSSVSETRQIPRMPCVIKNVEVQKEGVRVVSVENISSDGLLLNFRGALAPREDISISFTLPGEKLAFQIAAKVLYVINNEFKHMSSAGILFTDISNMTRIKISNFIVKSSSGSAMRMLQKKFLKDDISKEYKVTDIKKIRSIMRFVSKNNMQINVLFEQSYTMFESQVIGLNTRKNIFSITKSFDADSVELKTPDPVFVSFYLKGSTYYFKTECSAIISDRVDCAIPKRMYRSEKRSYQRKTTDLKGEKLYIACDGTIDGQLRGTIIDISRRGFLCEVPIVGSLKNIIKPGNILHYFVDDALGLDSQGEIRHLCEVTTPTGDSVLRIGVEASIRRRPVLKRKFSQSFWKKQVLYKKPYSEAAKKAVTSHIVRYKNKEGKHLSALVNYTRKHAIAPVVILPPAFGKKKETLSPLAATLISNFRHFGKDIVTLRFDGINRPGESYNDDMCPKRGYEMLHYRMSQGLDDLRATLDYINNNHYFISDKVILIAFSMSALDARKLLINQPDPAIDYCINVMGVTCGQSALSNITGGMDIIGNFKMGIPNGISGLLGHLIDFDNLSKDIIDQKYAYLTDARLDMSKINIPISWIYGKYDKWVVNDEVSDIMSIASKGEREIIEIPTGHNLRSSDDAIKTFKMITALIYQHLYGEKIKPIDPDKENMVRLIAYERERFSLPEDFNARTYWKDYLIGSGDNKFGYDFFKNMEEFRDFLSLETDLIDLQDGEKLADMGCGTGLFIENLLQNTIEHGHPITASNITLVDLVQEALDKTRFKYEKLMKSHYSLLPPAVNFIQKNLDPNRLIPLKLFLKNRRLMFDYLRNRIEGLKNVTVDHILLKITPQLYEIIRGAPYTDELKDFYKNHFNKEACEVIGDLNRAARFLSKKLSITDIQENKKSGFVTALSNSDYSNIRTTDIVFEKLAFGDNGLDLELPFEGACYDKIVASLFISYLFNPEDIIHDFYRMLKPGGKVLVSSMKPDSDISQIFTKYIDKVQHFKLDDTEIKNRDINLAAARAMLNEAAALFELEEDGYFKFYSSEELHDMLYTAGFKNIQIHTSLGNPAQAVIVTGEKT